MVCENTLRSCDGSLSNFLRSSNSRVIQVARLMQLGETTERRVYELLTSPSSADWRDVCARLIKILKIRLQNARLSKPFSAITFYLGSNEMQRAAMTGSRRYAACLFFAFPSC